jgi:hypothetical protein
MIQFQVIKLVSKFIDVEQNETIKKYGFIIDLNINRILYTFVNYSLSNNELNRNIDIKIRYLIENNLINIDADMMEYKQINADTIIRKLLDVWQSNPLNSYHMLVKMLENEFIVFDNEIQKQINKEFSKSLCKNKLDVKIRFKDEDDEEQELPNGKQKVKDSDDDSVIISDSEDESEIMTKKEEQKDIDISFTTDIIPFVLPLSCILTIKDNNNDFVKILDIIKENPELLEIFNDQCVIWWQNKNLITLIRNIINKYYKNSNTSKIILQFKMSLKSLIDKPKELLELINSSLKPKREEKKKFGEVFTPMELVNEMLDKLDECYKKEHKKSIFEEKDFKWFDPANGMGNFPVAIYMRLNESLKSQIPNDKERKKHIIENMLYMSELNKKNCLITKQIFNMNNEYKLNLYEGDSLKLDVKKEFDVDKFDVIVGNPPYQEIGSSGKPIHGKIQLYTKFIIKFMNNTKYLLFITPSSLLTPSSPIYNLLLKDNSMIYLNNNNNKFKKYFTNVGSTFCYYIIENTHKKNDTIIENEYGKFKDRLYNYDFLPKIITKETLSLNKKILINTETIFERKDSWECKNLKDKCDNIFKYPQIIKHNLIKYSNEPHKLQDKHKVLLFRSGYLKPLYTKSGFGGNILYKLVNNIEEGNNIVNNYDNKIIKFILDINKFSGFNNQKIINMIYNDEFTKKINIKSLYNITNEEIKFIEENM